MCAELPMGSVPLYGVCLLSEQCQSGVCFGDVCMEACEYDEDCDTYPDGRCSPGGVGRGCNYACDGYPPEAFVNADCTSETARWTTLTVPSLCEACGDPYCH